MRWPCLWAVACVVVRAQTQCCTTSVNSACPTSLVTVMSSATQSSDNFATCKTGDIMWASYVGIDANGFLKGLDFICGTNELDVMSLKSNNYVENFGDWSDLVLRTASS